MNTQNTETQQSMAFTEGDAPPQLLDKDEFDLMDQDMLNYQELPQENSLN